MAVHSIRNRPLLRRVGAAAKAGVILVAVAALFFVFAPTLHDAGKTPNTASAAVPASPKAAPTPRDFDYFPDHYQLQAKEPAERVDTF